jgi:hypothetical protein
MTPQGDTDHVRLTQGACALLKEWYVFEQDKAQP